MSITKYTSGFFLLQDIPSVHQSHLCSYVDVGTVIVFKANPFLILPLKVTIRYYQVSEC